MKFPNVFSKLFDEGLQTPIIPSLEVIGKKRGWHTASTNGVNFGFSRIVFVIIVMVILPSLKQIHGIGVGDKEVFCRYCIIYGMRSDTT